MSNLPTPAEMLAKANVELDDAYRALGSAAEWLWSDWPPGYQMTEAQAAQRTRMVKAINAAKAAINEGRSR
jgi:hypothetical protein